MPKNEKRTHKAALITLFAMLTAISVVVGILCKNLFTVAVYYRFTLENIGIIFAGIFFGPGAGALVGIAVDGISCLLSTNPAVNPVIMLGALTVGVSSGIVSRYVVRERGLRQYILSAAAAHLLGQVIIKSIGKMIYFGMPWIGIFIGLACSVVACAVEVIVIRTLMKNTEIRKFVFRITGEK
jgi:ECF transporter S component (folate family)